MMQNRRKLVKGMTITGVVGALGAWKKPVINAVILPTHAQTSVVSTLSCAMTNSALAPIAEGATTNQDIILTFSTTPPLPGASLDWVGRCNGVDDFAVQTNTLDANGELLITVQTSLLCGGGPPANGDVILHNGILTADGGSSINCSIVFGP